MKFWELCLALATATGFSVPSAARKHLRGEYSDAARPGIAPIDADNRASTSAPYQPHMLILCTRG